jgi:hypothetical protein
MRFLNSLTKLFIISICILFVSSCYPKGKKSKVSFIILTIYFLSLSFYCQVEIGSDTYVCIFITPLAYSNTTNKYIRIAATLTADSLSRIRIPQGSLFGFSLLLVYFPVSVSFFPAWSSPLFSNDTVMKRLEISGEHAGSGLGVVVSSLGVSSYQRIYRQVKQTVQTTITDMTKFPSLFPSSSPSELPSSQPSSIPSSFPSSLPSSNPASRPTSTPSSQPSGQPSSFPSSPSSIPSGRPSTQPSCVPSSFPSSYPSSQPSSYPSSQPSTVPTAIPSFPTNLPIGDPTSIPAGIPSSLPSSCPSTFPSSAPSVTPTTFPSSFPTSIPSTLPVAYPTSLPSSVPTVVGGRRHLANVFPVDAVEEEREDFNLMNSESLTTSVNTASVINIHNVSYLSYPTNDTYTVTFPMLFVMITVERGKVKVSEMDWLILFV